MRLEQQNSLTRSLLMIAIVYCVSSIIFFTIAIFDKEELETDWSISLVDSGSIWTGDAVDFHLYLEDEQGNPINEANMKAVFDRPGTVHQIEKRFSRLENGLYETEIIFSVPGTWIAMVESSKNDKIYRNQLLFEVQGTIVSDVDRDPKDLFHLEQPLPQDLQFEIERIQNVNR
ncbi:hypothetical protein BkAM31D_04260 [Halalkalibacter krulwichiae]|uniref:YtkA-like domain-containing protein n=2 Tax=Halalkalibacter krulwichiae TaxID=199441 RepID=A0A1X9M6R9_9BACI|nr:FixH family protein [Halalkalibacter krulwichiae]ARK29128.1 hypothetical protein BkAM31D_04260 [Halalkalibacter krulwichiae]